MELRKSYIDTRDGEGCFTVQVKADAAKLDLDWLYLIGKGKMFIEQ